MKDYHNKFRISGLVLSLNLFTLFMFFTLSSGTAQKYIVSNQAQFKDQVKQAEPGDTIVMQNGVWKDAKLVFRGQGTAEKPIVLIAEEPGKVTLEGKSNLRIAGEYLVISGLVFRNGYTPDGAVISFRKDKDNLANHCRVTNTAIDHYNKKDRFKSDNWVVLYGKKNRFDHNYLAGKLNSGVTLIVKLNAKENQENHHSIDHNYFGYKPRLGSNGGESVRVGVSTYSLSSSFTEIKNNYFERCAGEVEIVSLKSSDNIVKGNTFLECEGVLALRHGNRNIIEENYFIGNGKPHTGGVRVINEGHTIRNNHFQELTGDRFFGPLPVMNGVPNSLINRYHHAQNVLIENNNFIYCDHIQFGVGTDNERTEAPENITFKNNLFYHPGQDNLFEELDDISTFHFEDNLAVNKSGNINQAGFKLSNIKMKKDAAGLFMYKGYNPSLKATAENCGPAWYQPIGRYDEIEYKGVTVQVKSGADFLKKAVDASHPGDIIELVEGEYLLTEKIVISHPITVIGNEYNLSVVKYQDNEDGDPLFEIADGGMLNIQNVVLDGSCHNGISRAGIRTSQDPMINHYKLKVNNCAFINFNSSRYCAFSAAKSTYADSVVFENCLFYEISGNAINLAGEQEERGKYNAEYIILKNCHFEKILGSAANILRGGNDESTLGPFLTVDHCSFVSVNNKELGSTLLLTGLQRTEIKNSLFSMSGRSGRAIKMEDPGWAETKVHHLRLYKAGRIESYYDRIGEDVQIFKMEKNATQDLGDDGKAIGASHLSPELMKILTDNR